MRRRRADLRPAAHDVAHREHADQLAAVDDDQVADAALHHLVGGPLEAPVGGCGDRRSRSCDRRPSRCPGPCRCRRRCRMSRSVMIRGAGDSSSKTRAAPVPFSVILVAASRSVWPGPDGQDHARHPLANLHSSLLLRSPLSAVRRKLIRRLGSAAGASGPTYRIPRPDERLDADHDGGRSGWSPRSPRPRRWSALTGCDLRQNADPTGASSSSRRSAAAATR